MNLTVNHFRVYDEEEGDYVSIEPDVPLPEEAKPYIVRISNDHWIPINVLVFASDEVHARIRVLSAMRKCVNLTRKGQRMPSGLAFILEELDKGNLRIEMKKLNNLGMFLQVGWATNDHAWA